jgi:cytochrome c peroxidase
MLRKVRSMPRIAIAFVLLTAGCTLFDGEGESAARVRLGILDPAAASYPGGRPSPEEVALGRRLFFDPILSKDRTLSCATCHKPELGLSDGRPLGVGLGGKVLPRHTPSLYNLAFNTRFFWDGRAGSLEEQARLVIQSPDELGMTVESAVERLTADPTYVAAFAKAYPGSGLCGQNLLRALANFERTLVSCDAPFDRYLRGEASALPPEAVRGLALFLGKANCVACHNGPNFTDGKFHNTGVPGSDPGRLAVVRNIEFSMRPYPFFGNRGAFKTASLRNVRLSPPYFHNGSEKTLEDVVRFYNRGGKGTDVEAQSTDVRPLGLSEAEIKDLVAFLDSLTSPVIVNPPK